MLDRRRVISLVMVMLLALSFPMKDVAGKDTIDLISPNGGENITGGDHYYIKWETSGMSGYVYISYTSTGKWEDEVSIATVENSGKGIKQYKWLVPLNLSSDDMLVKVSWLQNLLPGSRPIATDRSDSTFQVGPGIVLRFKEVPNEMSYARYYTTSWDLWDPFGRVMFLSLEMRVDEGSGYGEWEDIPGEYSNIEPSKGWTYWTPPYYREATIQIRISAYGLGLPAPLFASDLSGEIALASPWVTLLNFNGGQTFIGGQTYTIEWMTSYDPEQIIMGMWIEYSSDGGSSWNNIAYGTANDFEEDWTVPTEVDSTQVLIKVNAMEGEWQVFAEDESTGYNRIISDPNTLTISLTFPNPPVDQGWAFVSGEWARIEWEITGQVSDIREYKLFYSNDSGVLWTLINTTSSSATQYDWKVPHDDTEQGRIRVTLYKRVGGSIRTENMHDFLVIDDENFNRPPVADAGEDLEAEEGDIIELDGSHSYDPDFDTMHFHWEQVLPAPVEVELHDNDTWNPRFQVELSSFPVILIFELTVTDNRPYEGYWPYNVDRVQVEIAPKPPTLNETTGPRQGWAGTWLKVGGEELMGSEVLFKNFTLTTIPREPVIGNPEPDRYYIFRLPEDTPIGKGPLTVKNLEGSFSTSWDFEVHPKPQWNYDWGLGYSNPSKDWLSYPADIWNDEGNYHDTFGDEVFIMAWICLGIPYWSAWSGWGCWGERLEAPIAHDPIAALYYASFYGWLADKGECFGMSSAALGFYHEDIDPTKCTPVGDNDISEKTHSSVLKRHVEYMHGSQVSAEMINWYLREYIGGLVPSSSTTGMGKFLNDVKDAVDSGELGIISITEGVNGHAVVPYLVHEVDATHTRIYVYDPNRPGYSDPKTAASWANSTDDDENHPPYIEIEKQGTYWDWHFVMNGGHNWGGPTGIAFVPYSKITGPRSLPTSWEGLLTVITGTNDCSVESESGTSIEVDENGTVTDNMTDGIRLPLVQGGEAESHAFAMEPGNLTMHITGTEDGTYNWTTVNNSTSVFALLEAEVANGSMDTIGIINEEGNPLRGRMTYSTTDPIKNYSATHIKRMGFENESVKERQRVYSILNATLFSGSELVMNTTDDYNSLMIENRGPHTFTYDVEFLTNVLSREALDRIGGKVGSMPRAFMSDITIGPFETQQIRPTDWLDLDNSSMVILSNGTRIYPEVQEEPDDDDPIDDDAPVDDDVQPDDDTTVDDEQPDDDTTVDDDEQPDGETADEDDRNLFILVAVIVSMILFLLLLFYFIYSKRSESSMDEE
ncbi:MAG: hypothetical protein R6V01_06825 [Thermoplasmatota archaeon]